MFQPNQEGRKGVQGPNCEAGVSLRFRCFTLSATHRKAIRNPKESNVVIGDFSKAITQGRVRASAVVKWEDCSYGEREVFFETDISLRDSLTLNPNAFLLASIHPAMWFGESRIKVEGPVCPVLRDGLDVAARIMRRWYGGSGNFIAIEADEGFKPSRLPAIPRAASCMSGGVDSLATFRRNRLNLPMDHPGAVKDLLFIQGFDMSGTTEHPENHERFGATFTMLSEFAEAQHAVLVPISNNIRVLNEDPSGLFYTDLSVMRSFAATIAACAHAFSNRLTTLLIPSSHDLMSMMPLGSHPLLDPNYSSASLAILHDGVAYSRMDKMRLLSEWPDGLNALRVCADALRTDAKTNCGKCEKCLRTKISLLVLGILHQCPTFEDDDVTASEIDQLWIEAPERGASPFGYLSHGSNRFWESMLEPIRELGRDDLVAAIEGKLSESERFLAGNSWKYRLSRFDQEVLGGNLRKAYRRLRGREDN